MVRLRRATRDAVGPEGNPVVGRGYEPCADDGEPLARDRLRPGRRSDIAVVEVLASSVAERQALSDPAFGVGREVTLRVEAGGVAVLDAGGGLRAGHVAAPVAPATADLLERGGELAAWVSWEWVHEGGRSGIEVALSRPDLAPRRLEPPSSRQPPWLVHALRGHRVWVALAAVIALVLIAFSSCL